MRPYSPELTLLCGCLADVFDMKKTIELPSDINWDRFVKLVKENRLETLLGSRMRTSWSFPAQVIETLESAYDYEGSVASFKVLAFQEVLNDVSPEVPLTVLKGGAIIPLLYRQWSERLFLDIDFLVLDRASGEKAVSVLEAQGYRAESTMSHHHHLSPLVHPSHDLLIEFHTNLRTPPMPDSIMAYLRNHQQTVSYPGSVSYQILDDIGLLIHHAVHALNDPIKSPLLRNLLEVALLVRRLNSEQKEKLRSMVDQSEWSDMMSRALWLASDLFNSDPIVSCPAYSAYELWCRSRLEWCDYSGYITRVKQELAERHFVKLNNTCSPTGWGLLAKLTGQYALTHIKSFIPSSGINSTDIIQRDPNMDVVDFDGVYFLLHKETGQMHLLNELAVKVWDKLETPMSQNKLRRFLKEQKIPLLHRWYILKTLLKRGVLRVDIETGN